MYWDVKAAHVFFVALSLGLFTLRGCLILWDGRKPGSPLLRILPPLVDTLLLACGIWLLLILRLNPFTTPWLEVKLLCVATYIFLGVLAFRLERPWYLKVALFVTAIALFGFIASIALTHDPRGIFNLL